MPIFRITVCRYEMPKIEPKWLYLCFKEQLNTAGGRTGQRRRASRDTSTLHTTTNSPESASELEHPRIHSMHARPPRLRSARAALYEVAASFFQGLCDETREAKVRGGGQGTQQYIRRAMHLSVAQV